MKRLLLAVAWVVGLAMAARAQDAHQPPPVDVALVLAVDSSSSVQMSQFYLQLSGYAAAFIHPDLLTAIKSGPHQAIAVTMFEWSTPDRQQVNLGWRVLREEADLREYSNELANAPRLITGGSTAIGSAIDFAGQLLESSGVSPTRRVIDVSGDGANNAGRSVVAARDEAAARGITINGLAVLHQEPDLADHYRRFVVVGPQAFVLTATSYADFAEVILRKLVREITVAIQLPSNQGR
jgi:hypothetical protein